MNLDFGWSDCWKENFYTFELAMRARYEPDVPVDMTLRECSELIQGVVKHRATVPVYVCNGTGKTGTCTYYGLYFVVALPCARRRPWCALHEAAHVLTWGDGHGPTFARLVIDLWSAHGGWPLGAMEDAANNMGVPLADEVPVVI